MQLLDGRARSREIVAQLHQATQKLAEQGLQPKLVVITVGDDHASQVYVTQKQNRALEIGFAFEWVKLAETTTQAELNAVIATYNQDATTHGIIVQLPLPAQLDPNETTLQIAPEKDVDGFHPMTMGYVVGNHAQLYPCTPKGIVDLLDHAQIPLEGANVVVIGRSQIVGLPLSVMLIHRGATVTVCNSKTQNLTEHTQKADIVVAAVGRPHLIDATHLKEGAVVVDVGINRLPSGKLTGDVDFDDVKNKVSYITPVPGGVGPMTVAMLMQQTFECCCRQNGLEPATYFEAN